MSPASKLIYGIPSLLAAVYLVLQIVNISLDISEKVKPEPVATSTAPIIPPTTTGAIPEKRARKPAVNLAKPEKSFFEDPISWWERNTKSAERETNGKLNDKP